MINKDLIIKISLATLTFVSVSLVFSWKFALVFLTGVGLHEYGHVWAMRYLNIPTKGFYFLPFLGGVAIGTGRFGPQVNTFFVSIMGPAWGMLFSVLLTGLYFITGLQFILAMATWNILVNLFNLIPIYPLDGGAIVKSIGESINRNLHYVITTFSLIASIVAIIVFKLWLLAPFLIFTVLQILRGPSDERPMDRAAMVRCSLLYFAVSIILTGLGLILIGSGELTPETINILMN